jgi:hypothetical protein|eukprot:COSAG01_NODE_776_length_13693_cov_79.900029_19_plen_82_part_00
MQSGDSKQSAHLHCRPPSSSRQSHTQSLLRHVALLVSVAAPPDKAAPLRQVHMRLTLPPDTHKCYRWAGWDELASPPPPDT